MGLHLHFFYGDFYHFFKAAMDTFFLLIILGVAAATVRLGISKPSLLDQPAAEKLADNWENRAGYWLPLILLILIPVTGLMLEAARINATHPQFTEWAYLGRNLTTLEGALASD